jgi:hypothetical protein
MDKSKQDLSLAADGAEVLAAMVGGLVAGPVGVGSATLLVVGSKFVTRRGDRMIDYFRSKLSEVSIVDQRKIGERLTNDDEAEALFVRVADSVREATTEQQVGALGDLLVSALIGDDPSKVDEADLLRSVLHGMTKLEQDALQLLAAAEDERRRQREDEYKDDPSPPQAAAHDVVTSGAPVSPQGAEAVVTALETRNMVRRDPVGFDGWNLTALGRLTTQLLS